MTTNHVKAKTWAEVDRVRRRDVLNLLRYEAEHHAENAKHNPGVGSEEDERACRLAAKALRALAKAPSAPTAKPESWRCSCKREPQRDTVITWNPLCELHGDALP